MKRIDKKVGKYIAYRLKSKGVTYNTVAASVKLPTAL